MAYIQEKIKGKKIVSFKFKTRLGRDDNGKQGGFGCNDYQYAGHVPFPQSHQQ